MERIVKLVAPRTKFDFVLKLCGLLILCGFLNHIRDVVSSGFYASRPFLHNLQDASFTALPMCILALLLIKHLNHLQQSLYKQATTDPLTQISNRRWFMNKCGPHVEVGQTLVLIDLDKFKAVNDTYGHDAGDTCLRAMADHVLAQLPMGADCARLGGEEFGVLFQDAELDVATDVTDRICAGVSVDIAGAEDIKITASAGLFRPMVTLEVRKAFEFADVALYQAKATGRARYVISDAIGQADVAAQRPTSGGSALA